MTPHAQCLLLCLLLVLLPRALSQREDYDYKKWQANRFWFWSADAPMTRALGELPDVVRGTDIILRHFERVEKRIYARVGTRIPDDENLTPCASIDKTFWPRAVDSSFGAVGFPQPDLSCITDFTGVLLSASDEPGYTVDSVYEAALKRGLAIQRNARDVAATFIDLSNYTGPDFNFNYPFSTPTMECRLHAVNGVRVRGRWRLATGIQNRPILETLSLFARENIIEYHRVVDRQLGDNALMRLAVRPETGEERVVRNDTTTFIFNGRGPANPSMYRNIPIEENPAILEALDKASVYAQQAEDAITPSNIAILGLPLALNIVPITLFAHVSTVKMLLYLILTDMLTVIPLLIKGVELVAIQGQTHRAAVVRLSSSFNDTAADAAAGELWAAECQAREKVREVGLVFVAVSVVFLVGGVLLELAARECLRRRNERFGRARRSKRAKLGKWSRGSESISSTGDDYEDDRDDYTDDYNDDYGEYELYFAGGA